MAKVSGKAAMRMDFVDFFRDCNPIAGILWLGTKFGITVHIDEARTHVVCTMIDDVMLALLCRQNRLVRLVLGRLITSWAYNSHLNFSQSESSYDLWSSFPDTGKVAKQWWIIWSLDIYLSNYIENKIFPILFQNMFFNMMVIAE